MLTDEASLDLTGINVSNIKVASANATGTTFTVDNVNTALSIVGGPGDDTIDASTITLAQSQRDLIFLSGSVETIIDSTGMHTTPFGSPTVLTTADDTVVLGNGGEWSRALLRP